VDEDRQYQILVDFLVSLHQMKSEHSWIAETCEFGGRSNRYQNSMLNEKVMEFRLLRRLARIDDLEFPMMVSTFQTLWRNVLREMFLLVTHLSHDNL
jgi:hypothetical protein